MSIRKLPSGTYFSRIVIKGKLYCKTFQKQSDALEWEHYLKSNKKTVSAIEEHVSNVSHTHFNDLSDFIVDGRAKCKKVLEELVEIDNMSGTEFEDYCIKLLYFSGLLPYSSYSKTKKSGDFGADIIITTLFNLKISVQCKRLKSSPIRVDAIQEVVASKEYYKTKKCMIISNSKLTPAASELALKNNVLVVDRDKLIKLIKIKNSNLKPIIQKKQWNLFVQQLTD